MSQGWYFRFIKTSSELLMIILWAMGILILLLVVMEQSLLDWWQEKCKKFSKWFLFCFCCYALYSFCVCKCRFNWTPIFYGFSQKFGEIWSIYLSIWQQFKVIMRQGWYFGFINLLQTFNDYSLGNGHFDLAFCSCGTIAVRLMYRIA